MAAKSNAFPRYAFRGRGYVQVQINLGSPKNNTEGIGMSKQGLHYVVDRTFAQEMV